MRKFAAWSYKELEIEEGFKPESKHFQYFFLVSKGGEKKCNYCVWIDDDNLGRFSASKSFEEIISSAPGMLLFLFKDLRGYMKLPEKCWMKMVVEIVLVAQPGQKILTDLDVIIG